MPVEEDLDNIVDYELPRMDQGSLAHTRRILKTVAWMYGIEVTRDQVNASIRRCGFIPMKIPGRRLQAYIRNL